LSNSFSILLIPQPHFQVFQSRDSKHKKRKKLKLLWKLILFNNSSPTRRFRMESPGPSFVGAVT